MFKPKWYEQDTAFFTIMAETRMMRRARALKADDQWVLREADAERLYQDMVR